MYYTSSPISNKPNRIADPSHTKTVRHYKSASKAPAAASHRTSTLNFPAGKARERLVFPRISCRERRR